MKKLIIITVIIFVVSYLVSMATMGVIIKLNTTQLLHIMWEAIFLMFICFTIVILNSDPKPKIKYGQVYKLRTIVALNNGEYSFVLSHGDNVETYRCAEIAASLDPIIGNEYRVEIENGVIYFTS